MGFPPAYSRLTNDSKFLHTGEDLGFGLGHLTSWSCVASASFMTGAVKRTISPNPIKPRKRERLDKGIRSDIVAFIEKPPYISL
jgi:hypothetical protein